MAFISKNFSDNTIKNFFIEFLENNKNSWPPIEDIAKNLEMFSDYSLQQYAQCDRNFCTLCEKLTPDLWDSFITKLGGLETIVKQHITGKNNDFFAFKSLIESCPPNERIKTFHQVVAIILEGKKIEDDKQSTAHFPLSVFCSRVFYNKQTCSFHKVGQTVLNILGLFETANDRYQVLREIVTQMPEANIINKSFFPAILALFPSPEEASNRTPVCVDQVEALLVLFENNKSAHYLASSYSDRFFAQPFATLFSEQYYDQDPGEGRKKNIVAIFKKLAMTKIDWDKDTIEEEKEILRSAIEKERSHSAKEAAQSIDQKVAAARKPIEEKIEELKKRKEKEKQEEEKKAAEKPHTFEIPCDKWKTSVYAKGPHESKYTNFTKYFKNLIDEKEKDSHYIVSLPSCDFKSLESNSTLSFSSNKNLFLFSFNKFTKMITVNFENWDKWLGEKKISDDQLSRQPGSSL